MMETRNIKSKNIIVVYHRIDKKGRYLVTVEDEDGIFIDCNAHLDITTCIDKHYKGFQELLIKTAEEYYDINR